MVELICINCGVCIVEEVENDMVRIDNIYCARCFNKEVDASFEEGKNEGYNEGYDEAKSEDEDAYDD